MNRYQIIYADPNWSYVQGGRGAARNHYETSSTAAIGRLPIRDIAAEDSVLFLWATWPCLVDAVAMMTLWGYNYKTLAFLWVKYYEKCEKPFWGTGSWTRANSEICLLGVRGDVRRINKGVHQLVQTWGEHPEPAEQDATVLHAIAGKHSSKPPEVRERIVKLMGDLPRIELFARQRAPGWHAWGDDKALGTPDVNMVLA